MSNRAQWIHRLSGMIRLRYFVHLVPVDGLGCILHLEILQQRSKVSRIVL